MKIALTQQHRMLSTTRVTWAYQWKAVALLCSTERVISSEYSPSAQLWFIQFHLLKMIIFIEPNIYTRGIAGRCSNLVVESILLHPPFFSLFNSAVKDARKYDLVSDLLKDAQSCHTFKGTVSLAVDLKIIPVITAPASWMPVHTVCGFLITSSSLIAAVVYLNLLTIMKIPICSFIRLDFKGRDCGMK